MKTRKKILLGGLGALTPVIMNLLVVDLKVLAHLTPLVLLGYVIRVVVLFYLGGLMAYLHKDEKSPVKLFELGIVAPALITALLNAAQVEVPKAPKPTSQTTWELLLPAAYAQVPQKEEIKSFALPKESRSEEFWRGLTGSHPKRVWFVIVRAHRNLEDARKEAQEINQKGQGFNAELYSTYGRDSSYEVVIGANLTYEEAQKLRQQAIAAGFPRETYLWTFPK